MYLYAVALLLLAGLAWRCYSYIEGVLRTIKLATHLLPMAWEYVKLRYTISGFAEKLQKPHWDAFHEKWADEPLRVCLSLRGFYVKLGQVMASQPEGIFIPKPYTDSLKALIEDVPPQPIRTIRKIVESELGCRMSEVFPTFEEMPIGAASIGQVHLATLRDGTRVVVKVQYPDTEKFFRLDIATIILAYSWLLPDMVEVLRDVEGNFEIEFNYALEAANLRRMCDEVAPNFQRWDLRFPRPYDERHPNLRANLPPTTTAASAAAAASAPAPTPASSTPPSRTLVTKRVLTMDLCAGESVLKVGKRVVAQLAEARGQTADELQAGMQNMLLGLDSSASTGTGTGAGADNSNSTDRLLAMASQQIQEQLLSPTESQFDTMRALLKGRDLLRNSYAAAFNFHFGWLYGHRYSHADVIGAITTTGSVGSDTGRAGGNESGSGSGSGSGGTPPIPYKTSTLPINGPRLLARLFEIHGFEIFEVGAFNADPHAGNMLVDEATGQLSLIDYGQLIEIDEGARELMAELFCALADEDGDSDSHGAGAGPRTVGQGSSHEHARAVRVARCYARMGMEVTDRRTGIANDPQLLLAIAYSHFGGVVGLQKCVAHFGKASLTELMDDIPGRIGFTGMPAYYQMVQRCTVMLAGVGVLLGFAGADAAKLLRPSAQRYLEKLEKRGERTALALARTTSASPAAPEERKQEREQEQDGLQEQTTQRAQDQDQALEQWLQHHAGLSGKKLAVALNQCDDGMIESLADLEHLHSIGQLDQAFPQSMLRAMIATALDQAKHGGGGEQGPAGAAASATKKHNKHNKHNQHNQQHNHNHQLPASTPAMPIDMDSPMSMADLDPTDLGSVFRAICEGKQKAAGAWEAQVKAQMKGHKAALAAGLKWIADEIQKESDCHPRGSDSGFGFGYGHHQAPGIGADSTGAAGGM